MEETSQHLLYQLKITVEGLLITQPTNVWHVYGGLNRLHSILEKIFKHGCRVFNQEGEPDCWIFIQGLSWLQPSLAASPTFIGNFENAPHSPGSRPNKAKLWLLKSLESHTLSQKLSWLLTDREHLLSCFKPTAFLCQEKYSEATLICLQAVEQNQLSLLSDIDPSLYLLKWNVVKSHRRCASFPDGIKMTVGCVQDRSSSNLKKEGTELMSISPPLPNLKIDTVESSLSGDVPSNSPKSSPTTQITDDIGRLSPSACTSENKSASYLMRHKPWHSSPCLSDTRRPFDKTNHDSSEKHKYLNAHESKTEPSSPAIGVSSRFVKKSPCVSPTNKDLLKSISVLRIDYKELQKNELVTTESTRTGVKLKSGRMKSPMTDCIVMHDVPKSESLLIKSDNSVSDTPLVNSTSCSSSSVGCNESFISSSGSNKNARRIASARRKRKDNPKLFSVPHSIWEETDDLLSESKVKSSGKLKRVSSTPLVQSAPEKQDWNVTRKKSFIEDGGSSIQPMSTKFFPRPTQGQSLASFLSSSQFTRANAELDRENAHFSISEAIISAIEQVKCNQLLGLVEENVYDSDEEINCLKQRIRLRRRQKQEERRRTLIGIALLSDGKTDTTTTTDQSASPLSSSLGGSSDSLSTDGVDDLELDQVTSSNLDDLSKSGLSMSMASLYSEAEISRTSNTTTETLVSAEAVALSLLSQFSDKQLPRASDIEWLVSEQDAPQQLLPLPKSWPVSPDEAEDQDMRQATLLRGTTDWAPPRPQVIFTLHPSPVRRVLMTKQNYRCAGCGMKVVPDYAHKYRYCEYLGRFFCTGCHMNQQAIIPGRVLSKWDFAKYPVSSFSFRLLDQMFTDPLFNIEDLSPNLYRRARCLEKIRALRLQLFYLKDFLLTCRFAKDLAKSLESEAPYIVMEPDVYSLQDLIAAKGGEMGERLKELVSNATTHVKSCQLCQVRGFVCEVCRSQEVIYPWELEKVVRCIKCGSCFHSNCYSPKLDCPRCLRISKRLKNKSTPVTDKS